MTAKQYLSQAYRLNERINSDLSELDKRKINAEIDRLVDLKTEISEAISQLANVDEQLLLRFRYINNYGWEKIAVLMSVSMRTVHRIHASALRNFQPPE